MEEKIYPMLPTAPQDESGSNYRLQKISEIEQKLQDEIQSHRRTLKKYKKVLTAFHIVDGGLGCVDVASTAASLGLLASGIGSILALPMQAVALASGALGVGGMICQRRLSLKAKKHDEIRILAGSKLNTVSMKVAKAFDDGRISDEEFRTIVNELDQYNKLKEEITTKTYESILYILY